MKDKKKIYDTLRKNIITYKQAMTIKSVDAETDKEIFIKLPNSGTGVIGRPEASQVPQTFGFIVVRKTVYNKCHAVDLELKQINPDYQLVVAYGYRSFEIQECGFAEQLKLLRGKFATKDELLETANINIANQKIAGHPTGGAVDVTIFNMREQRYLDFGTPNGNFDSNDIFVFSPFINDTAKNNRKMLRHIMQSQGFLPFNGEWWHFSYGDKEWSFANNRTSALYSQKNTEYVLNDIGEKCDIS